MLLSVALNAKDGTGRQLVVRVASTVGHASLTSGQEQAAVQPKGVGGVSLQLEKGFHTPPIHF